MIKKLVCLFVCMVFASSVCFGAIPKKVKVSDNDTTSGYLNDKATAGDGISFTENNDGGAETLTIAVANLSTSGINWDSVVNAELQTSGINWDSVINSELSESAINWDSIVGATTDYVLTKTTSGVNWQASAGGISNVVEDTTPQLGGNLDLNSNVITGLEIGTDVQAYDADLTTYAGITPSANVQSILGAATYAAMRTLLDLEAGTDFYSISAADSAFEALDTDITKKNETEVITGDWDFGGGGLEIENGTTPPACTVGQIYLDTDATSGQQLYACEGGSFVLQGDGGGAETNSLETVVTGIADDEILVGTAADTGVYKAIGDCDGATNALTYDVTTNAFSCNTIAGGSGDSVSVNSVSVTDPDFVSTGQVSFTDTTNTITADITNDSILEIDLKAVDAAVDEDILTYESTTGDFEWHSAGDLEASFEAVMDLQDMQGAVTDAQVPDTITITNISQVGDITATASEINTPLDGASVTLTEFQELETIGATTISANQWAALGGIAETLTSTELNLLDGITTLSGSNTGDEASASTTTSGIVELATIAETDTGTDTARVVTPDGLAGSIYGRKTATFVILDSATATSVADNVGSFTYTIPVDMNGMNITDVECGVETAGTTGTTDVQVHNITGTGDVLSTKCTIDSAEVSSLTAATAPVINTAEDDVATGDRIRFDVDAISTTPANGLWVQLTFETP